MDTRSLVEFLNTYAKKDFCWGTCDCSTFILDYLKVSTGKDYAHLVKSTWKSKAQAVRYSKQIKRGVGDVISEYVDGKVVEHLREAKTGDILVLDQNGWQTAGIFFNGKIAFFVEGHGLNFATLAECDISQILRAS